VTAKAYPNLLGHFRIASTSQVFNIGADQMGGANLRELKTDQQPTFAAIRKWMADMGGASRKIQCG